MSQGIYLVHMSIEVIEQAYQPAKQTSGQGGNRPNRKVGPALVPCLEDDGVKAAAAMIGPGLIIPSPPAKLLYAFFYAQAHPYAHAHAHASLLKTPSPGTPPPGVATPTLSPATYEEMLP